MSGRPLRYFAIALFFWLGIGPGRAASDPAGTAFDAANKLYEQGKYAEAASAYQQLLKSGQSSAAVYFNLGNAWFKAGQMGRAIEAYSRAETITPRDPDVRANLQFARNHVQGPTYSSPLWRRWLGRLSLNEWTFLACAVVWVWLLLLTVLQWRPSLRPMLRVYTIVLGMAVALVCSLLLVTWREHRSAQAAVVISKEANVRQGPLDESQSTFTLHDGAEVLVLDRKDDWLQISTDPRRIGWVKQDQVVRAPNI